MRAHVAIHLEQWFLDYVRPFINGNAEAEVPRIKRDHCRRVAEDMTGIARDLGLVEDDIHTARILGWLHDIGRFPQYAQYRTLRDDQSVNHGQAGLQVLENAKVLMVCEPADQEIIVAGVGYHNCQTVPDGMAADVRHFVLMIRDADKLDIMQTLYQIWKNDEIRRYPELILELDLEGPVSPCALADIRARRSIAYTNIKSLADFFLTQISWVYDLNFRPSYQRLAQRRLLEQAAEALPQDMAIQAEVAAAVQHVRACM
ncbi:MAG: HD domain-containing protein [Kiritimatiellae bacterium]|nr:HD domain-containing protein [Verrucomicrobiota bacterium]MBU4285457.1 HD domain-containing protein [Verrucomicrobiota bacterium]MBU4366788.1 HD domain-containing protein [Verrucomicrobiota bacterium]MCG2661814.1 HD domain-containing protein [Kiritimatiellia bacterium]